MAMNSPNQREPLEEMVYFTTECRSMPPSIIKAVRYEAACKRVDINCYEILPDDKKVKPYFDIELKPKHCIEGSEFKDCCKEILEVAVNSIEKYFDNDKLVVLNASNPSYVCCKTLEETWIISLHIIVSNYRIS